MWTHLIEGHVYTLCQAISDEMSPENSVPFLNVKLEILTCVFRCLIFNTVPSEGLKVPSIQCWFSFLGFPAHFHAQISPDFPNVLMTFWDVDGEIPTVPCHRARNVLTWLDCLLRSNKSLPIVTVERKPLQDANEMLQTGVFEHSTTFPVFFFYSLHKVYLHIQ